MKKQLLLLTLGGLLITGCSQVENVDQGKEQVIAFHPMVGKATRGTEINTGTLNSIKVYAREALTYEDTYTKGGSGVWTSVNKHFWPSAGTVKFNAYAPSTLTSGTVAINNYVQQITDFSPKDVVAQQEDLVVAYSQGTKAANETSGVPLNFKHALSQIVLKAKNTNADIKVEVKAVKLGNIYSKANFMFPNTVTNVGYVLPRTQWTAQSTSKDYATSIASSALTLNATPQDIMNGDGGMMLIPQQVTQWQPTSPTSGGAYIAVLCRIVDVAGGATNQLYPDPSISGNLGQFAYAAVGISPNWEPGKKYVYTLDFSNGYGHTPPNQGPGGTPNPGNDPGKPILDSPIKVTVTVDNWGPDQNTNIDM